MAENRYKILRSKNASTDENCKSIRALARKLEIGPTHISEIERDMREPSFGEILKYHNYFNVSIEYLIGESDETGYKVSGVEPADNPNTKTDKASKRLAKIMSAEKPEDVLIKQAVSFLLETTTGDVVMSDLADILFGTTQLGEEDLTILENKHTHEYHRIHNSDMETLGRRFVNTLMILRDPKYRKMKYNEIKTILMNVEDDEIIKDDYSGKCQYRA